MNQQATEVALIESAMETIEQVLARLARTQDAIPFFGPTDLNALSEAEQQDARAREQATYRNRPAESAAHFCLMSAASLLDVSRILMDTPEGAARPARAQQWKELMDHTKVAGRAAYRAALILADPAVPDDEPLPPPAKIGASDEAGSSAPAPVSTSMR